NAGSHQSAEYHPPDESKDSIKKASIQSQVPETGLDTSNTKPQVLSTGYWQLVTGNRVLGTYPTSSTFALARSCLARPERSFSYFSFCNSTFRSDSTSLKLCFFAGLCAFRRRMVYADSTWINPLTCPGCNACNALRTCGGSFSRATSLWSPMFTRKSSSEIFSASRPKS